MTQLEQEVVEAYTFLRTNNNTIPNETLDFMLQASKEKLATQKDYEEHILYWAKQLAYKPLTVNQLVDNAKWLIQTCK